MSKASLGYGMQRLKKLGLDKNVNYYIGDLELLSDAPPTPFDAGFDLITGIPSSLSLPPSLPSYNCSKLIIISATGVLHHLKNPMVGWRKLVEWLKPGTCNATNPTLPYPTLPYPTLPYSTLLYSTLLYSTLLLPYPTLPYPTLPSRLRCDEIRCDSLTSITRWHHEHRAVQ